MSEAAIITLMLILSALTLLIWWSKRRNRGARSLPRGPSELCEESPKEDTREIESQAPESLNHLSVSVGSSHSMTVGQEQPSYRRTYMDMPSSCRYLSEYTKVKGISTSVDSIDKEPRRKNRGSRFVQGDLEVLRNICLEVAVGYRMEEEMWGDVPVIRLIKEVRGHVITIYIRAPVDTYGMAYWIWAHIDGLHVYPPDPRNILSIVLIDRGDIVIRKKHTAGWAKNLKATLEHVIEELSELLLEIEQLESWEDIIRRARREKNPMLLYSILPQRRRVRK